MNCFVSERGSNPIWIAVSTHPNRERTAEFNLRNQGYDVYAPVIRKQIRHARRVSDVLRPLFPGYLFVCLASTQSRWRPILSTVGVRSVVCTRDLPCILPNQFLADLMAREKDGVIARPVSSPRVGESVRVGRGAFDGLVGKIIDLAENDRLVVLMDFLNRPVRVKISGDLLSVV
ncbi:transcription termination/antitermination protein NusG [Hyphomicrobium sp. ghe19]|uniref:transcription termination/antitermination protein NusG n=1 Tax=Hyphomicrobium sp. ghe19 TaxID=2682968 RepID=UPI001366B719|nr:Transcription antitermination protein RfaH [Hyphomicrobium sp. ghe19]